MEIANQLRTPNERTTTGRTAAEGPFKKRARSTRLFHSRWVPIYPNLARIFRIREHRQILSNVMTCSQRWAAKPSGHYGPHLIFSDVD